MMRLICLFYDICVIGESEYIPTPIKTHFITLLVCVAAYGPVNNEEMSNRTETYPHCSCASLAEADNQCRVRIPSLATYVLLDQ